LGDLQKDFLELQILFWELSFQLFIRLLLQLSLELLQLQQAFISFLV